jgi:hypothetical protein
VCSCSWCGIVYLLFFSTLGLVAASFQILHFRRGVHAYIARRESSSRETTRYQGSRLAESGRSVALLSSFFATLQSGYCEGFILTLFFTALIGMVA